MLAQLTYTKESTGRKTYTYNCLSRVAIKPVYMNCGRRRPANLVRGYALLSLVKTHTHKKTDIVFIVEELRMSNRFAHVCQTCAICICRFCKVLHSLDCRRSRPACVHAEPGKRLCVILSRKHTHTPTKKEKKQ